MNNLNNPQSESRQKKKAIASLIMGFISISLIPFVIILSGHVPADTVIYLFVLPVIGIIGIILGIWGLIRSTKKITAVIAIAGIILSIIGLIGLTTFLLIWLGFAIGM